MAAEWMHRDAELAFNFCFSTDAFKYFIMQCRLQIYVRSHIIIADLRGAVSRTHALRTNGMRVRVHAKIPIVLGSITLVSEKFNR